MMHGTHANADGFVTCEKSVQKDRATSNHDYWCEDEANGADDGVDGHVFEYSW